MLHIIEANLALHAVAALLVLAVAIREAISYRR
jgi:hypothetical protein